NATCQGFYIERERDTYLQATPGSRFKLAESGAVELGNGQMLATSGKRGLRIQTAVAEVLLDPDVAALIRTDDIKLTDVTVVDAPEDTGVVVRVAGRQFFALRATEQAVISNRKLGRAALEADDGVKRANITAKKRASYFVMQARVPIADLMARSMILQCRFERITWPMRKYEEKQYGLAALPPRVGRLDAGSTDRNRAVLSGSPQKVVQVAMGLGTRGIAPAGQGALAPDREICDSCPSSYNQLLMGNVKGYGNGDRIREHIQRIWMTPGTNFHSTGKDVFDLPAGTVLLAAQRDMAITTPLSTVMLSRGTIAIVSADDTLTRLMNLNDRKPGGARLVFGSTCVALNPGEQVDYLLGRQIDAKRLMMRPDSVAHRRMRFQSAAQGTVIALSDFSMVDALTRHPLLAQLRASREGSDRTLLNSLVKVAAAIALSQNLERGPYYAAPAGVGVALK
ncbi:MAG TPA: hypothetical protein V6D08_13340, partial [Candidatus Obscuribacterales bacterium]